MEFELTDTAPGIRLGELYVIVEWFVMPMRLVSTP